MLGAPAPAFGNQKIGGEAGSQRSEVQQLLAISRSAEQNNLKKH